MRESSLLTTYWSESTRDRCVGCRVQGAGCRKKKALRLHDEYSGCEGFFSEKQQITPDPCVMKPSMPKSLKRESYCCQPTGPV